MESGIQKHLLVTSTTANGEDCHVCSASVGAYVFENKDGQWSPVVGDREVLRFGAYGTAGVAKAIKYGPDVNGFSLTLEDINQGEAYTAEQFVAYVAGHYQPVLNLTIAGNNSGSCTPDGPGEACWNNQATVRFDSSTTPYYNILVDQTGTESTDSGIKSVERHKVFVFSGDQYVEQTRSSVQRHFVNGANP